MTEREGGGGERERERERDEERKEEREDKRREKRRGRVCFFVLCKRHWINRVPGAHHEGDSLRDSARAPPGP